MDPDVLFARFKAELENQLSARIGPLEREVHGMREQVAQLKSSVTRVAEDQVTAARRHSQMDLRIARNEETVRGLEPFREHAISQHETDLEVHKTLGAILARLDQQDKLQARHFEKAKEESEARAAAAEENRRQESIAAKRLEAERTRKQADADAQNKQENERYERQTKRLQVLLPIATGVLTVIGLVISGLFALAQVRASIQDSEARQAQRTSQILSQLKQEPHPIEYTAPAAAASAPPPAAGVAK